MRDDQMKASARWGWKTDGNLNAVAQVTDLEVNKNYVAVR